MEIKKLRQLKKLLIEWQSEYPFTDDHKETINKMVLWVENLIAGYFNKVEIKFTE